MRSGLSDTYVSVLGSVVSHKGERRQVEEFSVCFLKQMADLGGGRKVVVHAIAPSDTRHRLSSMYSMV